jgi:hypothetical protein
MARILGLASEERVTEESKAISVKKGAFTPEKDAAILEYIGLRGRNE